jgi:transketolase
LSRSGAAAGAPDARGAVAADVDVLVVSLGAAVDRANRIARSVADSGRSVRVLSLLRFDEQTSEDISRHVARARSCLTVEDHYRVGGLGSAVAEVIAAGGLAVPLVIDAVEVLPVGTVGSSAHMESKLHRSIEEIVTDLLARIKPVEAARYVVA